MTSRNERYEEFVDEFAVRPLHGLVMGLAEEAAEVLSLVSKHLFYGREIDHDELADECGDVLFYLTAIAGRFGVSTYELQDHNERKLRARFPEGPNGRQVR